MASHEHNAGPAHEQRPQSHNENLEHMSREPKTASAGMSQDNKPNVAATKSGPTNSVQQPTLARHDQSAQNHTLENSSDHGNQATSPNISTSTQTDSAGSSPTTSRDTTLDFAKREVSGSQTQHSFSVLSSMTRRSPQQNEDMEIGEGGEPVLQANDRERIRTPASAALRRTSASNDQIGRQESFGDNNTSSSSSENSVDRREAAAGALSNPTTAPPSETTSAEASPKDSLGFNFAPQRRRRHYEPARVVLHKSELQQYNNGDSAGNSARASKTNSEYELDPSTIATAVPALAQKNSSPPASPDVAIRGSLKQLREPRQPIYIPAVLRPTDFESYKTMTGISRFSAAASRRPVTQHWVRDAQAKRCAACERFFTWYRRRHHCRKCGSVFCATDTSDTIGLDRNLNFSLLGIPCRACSSCADEFAKYCLEAPRLRDGPVVTQPPAQGGEQEEVEVAGGGDWSTF